MAHFYFKYVGDKICSKHGVPISFSLVYFVSTFTIFSLKHVDIYKLLTSYCGIVTTQY